MSSAGQGQPEPPIQVRGPVGRLNRMRRDVCGLALQMTGFSRDPITYWEPSDDLEQQDGRTARKG